MKFLAVLLISLALMHHAHSVCVTVRSGDSCYNIEYNNGCAIGSIVASGNNGVNSGCTNLYPGQTVCCYGAVAPAVAPAVVYPSAPAVVYPSAPAVAYPSVNIGTTNNCAYVAPGDSCYAIESRMGWVKGSIVASNGGNVNSGCTNLQAGQYVCGYYTGNYNTNGCYTVQAGETCASIEARLGWAAGTVVASNSRINGACTNLYPGDSVCGTYRGVYTNTQTYSGCTYVQAGEGCNNVEARMGWAAGTIIGSNNGAVNSACNNLQVGQYVCGYGNSYNSGTIATSVVTNYCSRTIVVGAGQTCGSIASSLGINAEVLYANNPSLGYNCAGLYAGQTLCF